VRVKSRYFCGMRAEAFCAERIARSVTSPGQAVLVLAYVARALAQINPGRAARLAGDAERIARSVTFEPQKREALSVIAEMLLGDGDQHDEAWELGRGSRYAYLAVWSSGLG